MNSARRAFGIFLLAAALAGCSDFPRAHMAALAAAEKQKLFPARYVIQWATDYDAWQIALEGDHLSYTCNIIPFGLFSVTRTRRIHPTVVQWRAFWQAADAAEVWNWRREYRPRRVPFISGSYWIVSLAHGTRQVISEGYTAYPTDANPRKPGSEGGVLTGRYKRFYNAALQLVGTKPYF